MMHNDYFTIYISAKHKRLIGRRFWFDTVKEAYKHPCYLESREQTGGLMTFPSSLGVSMCVINDIVPFLLNHEIFKKEYSTILEFNLGDTCLQSDLHLRVRITQARVK